MILVVSGIYLRRPFLMKASVFVSTALVESSRINILGFLSNEQRIRTLYKKRVIHDKAAIIGDKVEQELSYLTAKECCEKIGATDLKEVYEKVRYSSEKVTSEDVRRAKG